MTIIYNKSHDYYLVGGLDEKSSGRNVAKKGRNLSGDFTVISSDQKINTIEPLTGTTTLDFFKKAFMVVLLAACIPFSATIATGYIHMMIMGK
jgi:hypothetical protein